MATKVGVYSGIGFIATILVPYWFELIENIVLGWFRVSVNCLRNFTILRVIPLHDFQHSVTLAGCLIIKSVTRTKFRDIALCEWCVIGVKGNRTTCTGYRNRFWILGGRIVIAGTCCFWISVRPIITSKQWRPLIFTRITEAVSLCPNPWWFVFVPCLFATPLRSASSCALSTPFNNLF